MITVRAYNESDVPALAVVMTEMALSYGAVMLEDGEIEADIVRDAQHMDIAVAFDAGALVGFASFTTLFPVAGIVSFTYIQQVYVVAASRRNGVGQHLMAWVARSSRDQGSRRVEWSTGMTNFPARALYDELGAVASEKMQYVLEGEAFDRLAARAFAEAAP